MQFQQFIYYQLYHQNDIHFLVGMKPDFEFLRLVKSFRGYLMSSRCLVEYFRLMQCNIHVFAKL